MKRLFLMGVVLSMVLGAGCEPMKVQQPPAPEVYWVMIDGAANVFDSGVYHNATAIGAIRSTETSPLQVTRLALTILPEHRERITTHTVFTVSAGRLSADELAGLSTPVAPGSVLLGFPSTLSRQWFKTRNVFSRSAEVAAETARALFAAMGDSAQPKAFPGR